MKHVLSVQDLSCLGKCSLTVALPVLSAMGLSCSVLPTAVLSTHTAFPQPHIHGLTEDMAEIRTHWQRIGAAFDGISIGYLSHPEQVAQVEALLDAFAAFTVLDPVMGDHGKLYSAITQDHVAAIKKLCQKADVLVPNITEACLLTCMPYRENGDMAYYEQLMEKLMTLGAKQVVLTGIAPEETVTGFMTSEGFVYRAVKLPVQCHGTGDLFAAVLTGGCLLGKSLSQAATIAAGFVEQVLANTSEASPFGVEFEPHLHRLMLTEK